MSKCVRSWLARSDIYLENGSMYFTRDFFLSLSQAGRALCFNAINALSRVCSVCQYNTLEAHYRRHQNFNGHTVCLPNCCTHQLLNDGLSLNSKVLAGCRQRWLVFLVFESRFIYIGDVGYIKGI